MRTCIHKYEFCVVAGEWRSLFSYCFIPYIHPFLHHKNPELAKHALSFYEVYRTVGGREVNTTILDQCEQQLLQFVHDFAHFYGEDSLVKKIHNLTHLIQSIRSFGPLDKHTMYWLEWFGKVICTDPIHGSTHYLEQIEDSLVVWEERRKEKDTNRRERNRERRGREARKKG